ncbi:MAG TPA: SulP family inorganic anion transporter [Planctomycetota bacterium]|nr:SulP family inorganic anion transporter [Planctomycetota bacterium]
MQPPDAPASAGEPDPPHERSPARRFLGATEWLRGYQPAWLRADLVAGVTLTAYLLPAAIGDASLANLPAEAGIYACTCAGFLFWLFCSSRQTTITVTSAISLLLGSSLGQLAGGDATRFGALAAGTALLVGLLGVIAWLVRAGSVVHFISETVMIGFKAGIALVLASTQLPKLFGFGGAHGGSFWARMHHFAAHAAETNTVALTIGLASLAVLLAGKRWLPGKPVAIVVVVGGVLGSRLFDLGQSGVKTIGSVPQGLPPLQLPAIGWQDLNDLLPLAFACFLLAAVETAAIGRMFAKKHGYRLDSDREFLAIGAANLAAGLGGGLPVSGGMSQSLVNESGGARTPLSGLVAAVLMLAVGLWFSGLLADLPQPVLAAIILMAVTSLIKVDALKRLWRAHRGEFLIALAAVLGVLGSGILRGIMIGAVISLVLLLRRAARPHVAFLGRIPGMQRFSDLAFHPDNEVVPGMLLFRVEASLLYFNVESVHEAVSARLHAGTAPPRLVVCDLSTSPHVDMAGAEMLADLHGELAAKNIQFQVVEARARVRDMLRREGLEARMGPISRRASLAEAVSAFTGGATGR